MKTNIIPCICCDHKPTSADSVYYGMPQLKVTSDMEHFGIFCPNCGRGGAFQFKSAYLAIKYWNEMQKELRDSLWFEEE